MKKISSQTILIINPQAGNGAAGRKREEIEALARKFFREHQTLLTDRPGRASEYARLALEAGADLVVCAGGDGTLNEVINGLMAHKVDKARRPRLGYLPLGTGSDLARTMGISVNLENNLRNIAGGDGKWVDLGRAAFTGPDRKSVERYFINVLSFALGGEVVRRVNRSSKVLGGFLTFLGATLTALVSFDKPLVRLRIDDKFDQQILCWHVSVANGKYQGGGMLVAPDARIDDGRLRVTAVGNISLFGVLLNLPRLYNGGIYSVDGVTRFSGRKIEAESRDRVFIDLDGEPVGTLPLSVGISPLALWLSC